MLSKKKEERERLIEKTTLNTSDKSVRAPIPLYPKKCEFEKQTQKIDGNFGRVITESERRGTKRKLRETTGKNGRRNKAEMKEPVQVAHGRYGCKSAYETYKRFARTNTRLGEFGLEDGKRP